MSLLKRPEATGETASSAVQVNTYVYMTAAHNVVGLDGHFYLGVNVYPAYRLPSLSIPIPIVGNPVYDQRYINSDADHRLAYDLAFVHTGTPRSLFNYATPWKIFAARDSGTSLPPVYFCSSLNSPTDPFYFLENGHGNSWYDDFDCLGYGATKNVVGYPDDAGGADNRTLRRPYRSLPVSLYGGPLGSQYFELYRRCSDCLPIVGIVNSHVSPGSSGGPLFGFAPGSLAGWRLLGIVTNQVGGGQIDGLATADFDYNDPWVQSNISWSPSNPPPVTITSPTEGATYDHNSVPNLVGSAGSQTAQLRWTSNIDGFLGTGGNVPVNGRLTTAAQTITASLGTQGVQGTAGEQTSTVSTVHISVTGSWIYQPRVYASPNPVVLPYGTPTRNVTISWTANSDSSNWRTDISYRLNGGNYVYWKSDVPAGSDVFPIHAGDAVTFYAYQHHYDESAGNTVTVTGQAGAAPTLSASPSTVLISPPATTGPFTLRWNAPGYPTLDLWGQIDNQPWHFGLTIPASGTSVASIPVGTTYRYRLFPHGDSTHVLAATAVSGVAPTFSMTPAHVIVPAGATSGSFTMTWSVPGYPHLDLWGQVNNDPWHFGLSIPASGATGSSIPVGTTYRYRFYPPGDSVNILGELSVYATH